MAGRSKQQQRPGSGKSNVGQAQASVSNILYIYFIIPILPNIPIATID